MRHVARHEGFRYPPRSSYEIGNECDERSPPLPRIRGNSRSNPSRKIVVGRKRIFPRTKEREREREKSARLLRAQRFSLESIHVQSDITLARGQPTPCPLTPIQRAPYEAAAIPLIDRPGDRYFNPLPREDDCSNFRPRRSQCLTPLSLSLSLSLEHRLKLHLFPSTQSTSDSNDPIFTLAALVEPGSALRGFKSEKSIAERVTGLVR